MMSEKRFRETERNCYYTSLVFDNQTQEELGTNKSVKLLNTFHEENKQLRKELEKMKPIDAIAEYFRYHNLYLH